MRFIKPMIKWKNICILETIIIAILLVILFAGKSFAQSAVIYSGSVHPYNNYYNEHKYYHENYYNTRYTKPNMTNYYQHSDINEGTNRFIKTKESTIINMGAFNRIKMKIIAHDSVPDQCLMWVFQDGKLLAEQRPIPNSITMDYFIWVAHPGDIVIYFDAINPAATLELNDIQLYKE